MRSVHTLITLWLAVAVSSVTASPEQSPYSPTEWRQLENLLGQGIADGKETAEKICGISPEIDNIAFQSDAGEPASNAQARRALLQGLHREQVMRLLVEADEGQRAETNLRSVDADNRALLARQFDQSGFPTTAEVGAQGVFAALMLTLHADPDLGLQRRGYDLMQASAANNAIPSTVPMMFRTLRANVLEGRQYTETYNVDGKDASRIDPTTLAPQACYQAISRSTRNAWLKQHLGDL